MRIPIHHFNEVNHFLATRLASGDQFAVFGGNYLSGAAMPECFSSREDCFSSIHTSRNIPYAIYQLPVLCEVMQKVLEGRQCVAHFVVNEPQTGALCIDMIPIYHLKYYPMLIADILQDVNWQRYTIRLPDALLNAIMLMRRLATIPGGQHVGRLLWDYHVPKGKYPVPNAIRNDHVRKTTTASSRVTIQNLIDNGTRNAKPGDKGPRRADGLR